MLPAMVGTSDEPKAHASNPAAPDDPPVSWSRIASLEADSESATERSDGFGRPDIICPFLLSADLSWRAATPQREHRCTAVTPRQPVALEVQRELCLVEAHRICDRFV